MSIVQISDFKGEITIANSTAPFVAPNLQLFINKYEGIYLTQLLGTDLYAQFISGLQVDPIPQKWIDLKSQIKYIPNYIYWYYIADQDTQTVGAGQAKTEMANAVNVSPRVKMVRAWNEMVENNFQVVRFINTNSTDYGQYYLPTYVYWKCHTWPEIFQTINTFGI